MIDFSDKMKKWIRTIPLSIIGELFGIAQEHDYASIREEREWNIEDEFWQIVVSAHRENNNPDDLGPGNVCFICKSHKGIKMKLYNQIVDMWFEGYICENCIDHYPIRKEIET